MMVKVGDRFMSKELDERRFRSLYDHENRVLRYLHE